MNAQELKQQVGQAALAYVPAGAVIGVGTGSTVDCFIDALAASNLRVAGAVSSSERSSERLRAHGIAVLDANDVARACTQGAPLPVYIDGADEIDPQGCMTKGGGAALTREKIVADMAEQFVCIADASKQVTHLGAFPLPVEVYPMALERVAQRLRELGGQPRHRSGVITDNGGLILDVHGLRITDPAAMENEINQWPGVMGVGIFARHRARICLLGTPQGVQTLTFG